MDELEILTLLRFGKIEDVLGHKNDIKKYLQNTFDYQNMDQIYLNPVIIKLTKYPKLYSELCENYLKMDLKTYINYIENIKDSCQLNYFNNYMYLTDYTNKLESDLADTYGNKQGRNMFYIKYIINKVAFELGITTLDNMYFIGKRVITNRDLRFLRRYNKVFINLFSDKWNFQANFLETLLFAYKELYLEVQNKQFKDALANQLSPKYLRWLKEIQIINYNPDYFLHYQKYFDIENDAKMKALNLLLSYSASKLTKEEIQKIKDEILKLEAIKETSEYQNLPDEILNLPNYNELKKQFPVLEKPKTLTKNA